MAHPFRAVGRIERVGSVMDWELEVSRMKTMERPKIEGQDASGRWHTVTVGRCRCGCPYLYALDDRAIVWLRGDWEPDDQEDERCTDRTCPCHWSALHTGMRRIILHEGPSAPRADRSGGVRDEHATAR